MKDAVRLLAKSLPELRAEIAEEIGRNPAIEDVDHPLEVPLADEERHKGIACTDRENDPYLGNGSVRFHEKFGYSIVGTFHNCGFKLGNWYSMVWMEKMVGPHEGAPEAVTWFPNLP